MPPWVIIKERRATFAALPEENSKRPTAATKWPNLFLAGDWTATGLPATIEGAIRSGNAAAESRARRRAINAGKLGEMRACSDHGSERSSSMRRSPRRRLRSAALQRADGHFVFELEADATIPAEYVLMRHYRGEPVDAVLEEKIARYLRRIQSADGGWPLFHAGASDISASVKAYFALKMIGDRGRRAAYGARARMDPRAWRRRQQQCVHPQSARALWRRSPGAACR